MIVDYTIHSDIPNYTKLAFSSLTIMKNDPVSQPIKQGMIGQRYSSNNLKIHRYTKEQKRRHLFDETKARY